MYIVFKCFIILWLNINKLKCYEKCLDMTLWIINFNVYIMINIYFMIDWNFDISLKLIYDFDGWCGLIFFYNCIVYNFGCCINLIFYIELFFFICIYIVFLCRIYVNVIFFVRKNWNWKIWVKLGILSRYKKKIYLYNNFLVWEKIKLKMKIKWWVKCDWFLFVRLVRDLKVINRYLDFGFRRLRYV